MATIINNDNIRELVAMYCHKKIKGIYQGI